MIRRSINIADVTLQPRPAVMTPTGEAAERFDCRMGPIAPLLGAEKLGYNLTVVPPGKRAFPCHTEPRLLGGRVGGCIYLPAACV